MQRNIQREKQSYKIPDGKITYSDLNVPAKPLFSKRYMLAGKPDYIVMNKDQFIPVEVKSGSTSYPQKNHVLQLAAYCQLLEDTQGVFVPNGILVYNNSKYDIPFDPGLRFELESVITTIRYSLKTGKVTINHQDSRKCHHCSMNLYCPSKLL